MMILSMKCSRLFSMLSGEIYFVLKVLSVNIVADMSPSSAAAFSCLSEEFSTVARSFNSLYCLKDVMNFCSLMTFSIFFLR